jgi:3-oxoacyl-(acyl-carrier-protein) synthase III
VTPGAIRSSVAGLGVYLPETRVSSAQIAERVRMTTGFALPPQCIERMTGIQERRHVVNGQHPSDLACEAGRRALADADLTPADVDTVIFASATQDLAEPATANLLQEKLGIPHVRVFDVKNACNSLLTATDLADSLIRTRKAQVVLVAAGEVCSYFIDYRVRSSADLQSLFSGLTLGDAGGALVVREAREPHHGICYSGFRSFGEHWNLSVVMGGGTLHGRDPEATYLHCRGRDLFEVAVSCVVPEIQAALDALGWTADDVDVVAAHQVALPIVHAIASQCGFDPERCAFSLPYAGNTAAASIPLALDHARRAGRLNAGTKVLCVGGASGFSVGVVGMVWGC